MKTHNSVEELLEDFLNQAESYKKIEIVKMSSSYIKGYASSNSLALGKQKPLAKNKQSDNIEYHNRCIRCKGIFWTEDAFGDKCSGCI